MYRTLQSYPINFRITGRNIDRLEITRSNFSSIPWPGFYIYNASKVVLRYNMFSHVAPRSLVFKTGQELEVSHNLLDTVASTLDASQFSKVTIYCNYGPRQPTCPKGARSGSSDLWPQLGPLVACLTSLMGHFWLLLLTLVVLLVILSYFLHELLSNFDQAFCLGMKR